MHKAEKRLFMMDQVPNTDELQRIRTDLAELRTEYARERNQLATERTFSSWIRTGLTGVGGGLALIKFISFKTPLKVTLGHLTGGILLFWGLLVIVFALRSFHRNMKHFAKEGDELSKFGINSIALILVLLLILIFIIVEI